MNRRWSIGTLLMIVVLLIAVGSVTAVVDPFFHYHKPLQGLSYILTDQRYQNDGIVKRFDYDAILTGSSMTERFKASEFDELFGVNSIKVPYEGGLFKEIHDNLRQAFKANVDIRYVVRSLDTHMLLFDKDEINPNYDYPIYLYDNNLLNDAPYLLSGDVLFNKTLRVLEHTFYGGKTTTFDEYSDWGPTGGEEAVRAAYVRPEKVEKENRLTNEQRETVRANIEQNFISLIREYPNTQFYCFIPPFSILFWDMIDRMGDMKLSIDAIREATNMLLEYENVHLFSFYEETELIENLDLYGDMIHYTSEVNSQILRWMATGEHRLTKENNNVHWDQFERYLTEYPFDVLFEQ